MNHPAADPYREETDGIKTWEFKEKLKWMKETRFEGLIK
jgi:hypothetical protein